MGGGGGAKGGGGEKRDGGKEEGREIVRLPESSGGRHTERRQSASAQNKTAHSVTHT